MRTTIALRNVIGKTQHALVVTIIPLHGDFNTNMCTRNAAIGFCRALALGIKSIRVKNFFTRVDELHKTCHTASTGVVVIFARTLIH